MNNPERFEDAISLSSIERLKWFRDKFIDERPFEKLNANDTNYHLHRCRGNYFQGVLAELSVLLSDGIITEPILVKKVNEFIQFVKEMDFSTFTKKEEIDRANTIINEVLDSIR